jgi:hypothetical protein
LERGIWIHQFSQLGEQTPQQIADTLLPRGITTIYPKAMDGTAWMGDIYSHPLAPTSAQSWARTVGAFKKVGLNCIAWVVNRWLAAEADVHVTELGELIVDFEYHYAGFWQGNDAQTLGYFDTMRQAVRDGVYVAVAPDPRQIDRDYRATVIRDLSAYLPQDYWTDFQVGPIEVLIDSFQRLAQFGPVQPILPYNCIPSDMEAALSYCYGQGAEMVSLWRMGTANDAQLDAFAQKVPGEEEDAPDMDEAERKQYQDKIDGLTVTVADIADRLGDQLLVEAKRSSVRKTVVRDIVKQMEAERAQAVGPRP